MDSIAQRKQALREQARRLVIPGADERSTELVERLAALPELERAGSLALYAPLRPEPLTEPLAVRFGARRLCYPVVAGDQLIFRESDGRELVAGAFAGLWEPAASLPAVPVDQIDVFIVPGLGFDRRGIRLGRGKGYYDRVLRHASRTATFIGVCFAECFVEALPAGPKDVPMDVIATDRALHRVIR